MTNIKNDINDNTVWILGKCVDANLSKTDIKILRTMLLIAKNENVDLFKNPFKFNQSELALALELKQPNVNRSIKKMVNGGVVFKYSENEYGLYPF